MEQWRLFKRSAVFLLFATLVYTVLLAAIPQRLSHGLIRNLKVPVGRYGHSFTRLQEVEHVGKVDVVFMGSSLTYRGYDARVFSKAGYRTFNLGSSSQTPLQAEMLALRYLVDLDPALVVLEVSPNNVTRDGVESSLDLLANGPVDLHAWNMTRRVQHPLAWNAFLYRWCRVTLHGPTEFDEPLRSGPDTYISGGYVQRDHRTNTLERFRPGPKVEPYAFQERSFERLLEVIRAKQIAVVLVNPSVTRPYYEHYNELHAFSEQMGALAPYVDMNEILSLDDSLHFYDSHHLNQNGVELYNAAVIEQLRKMGMLPDPR